MAVTKQSFQCTPRKIVIEPVWDGGHFVGATLRYTAEVSIPGIGRQDIGQAVVERKAEDMTPEELALYGAFAAEFDELAVSQLGCGAV
jgi:hypothetical protein